jgi:hypothetical protein
MEIKSRYVIKFFTDEDILGVEMVCRLRKHYGTMHSLERRYISGSTKSIGVDPISALFQALKESQMKILLPLLPESSMPTLISQPEISHIPWELQLQRRIAAGVKSWELNAGICAGCGTR